MLSHRIRFAPALVLVAVLASVAHAGDCPPLPCIGCSVVGPDVQPPDADILVFFDSAEMSAQRATLLANALRGGFDFVESPWQFPAGCANAPTCAPRYPVLVRDDIIDVAQVPINSPWTMWLNASALGDDQAALEWLESVMFHEWFHWIQLCSFEANEVGAWGGWLLEGTATLMGDLRTLAVDASPESEFTREVQHFDPTTALHRQDYDGALWWKYFSEQLGFAHDEPARGVNAIRTYFQLMALQGSPDAFGVLRQTIQSLGSDRNLEELVRDFAIANFIKRFDLAGIPIERRSRFRYFDENPAGGGTLWPAEAAPATQTEFGFGTEIELSGARLSAHYFDSQADGVADCTAIGMRGSADNEREAYWVAIALKGDAGSERVAAMASRRGSTFHHTFLNHQADTFSRIVGVVIPLEFIASFRVAFGIGSPQTEIVSPTASHPICVAPGARFGVEVRVSGPAELTAPGPGVQPSLSGLTRDDFSIKLVRGQNEVPLSVHFAHRIAAGTYACTVRVPEELEASGEDYDLVVCVCSLEDGDCGGNEVTELDAVTIGDFVTQQMIALDVSGSMGFENKLTAARNMARFLLGTSGPSNRMGIVAFSGNGPELPPPIGECDDDSHPVSPLGDMSIPGVRDPAYVAVDDDFGIPASGRTSIGDGLLAALDGLADPTVPPDKKRILLLTDGMENEAAFWDFPSVCSQPAVADSFASGAPGDGIQIHSRGFGNDADMDLLERIAGATGGMAEAVSTDVEASSESAMAPGGGASAGVTLGPDPMSLHPSNRLAESFRRIQEDALGLDRLFYGSVSAGPASVDVVIPLAEQAGGGVRRASFAFNWADGGSVTVTLRDGSGSPITAATPGWSLHVAPASSPQTHVVYHVDGVLAAQEYSATITATSPTQVICLLSGKLREGVDTELAVEPTRADQSICKRRLARGYPVRIWLTAAGAESGVAGLEPVAVIRNPDGSINRRTLFDDGNHDDGEAGDGIYANTYPRTSFARGSFSGMADTEPPALDSNLGTYSVTVLVSGENEFGESFTRYESETFTVIEDSVDFQCPFDVDEDGMADRWETLVGLDPADPSDADRDEDDDGVVNIAEFHAGTHPFNPDTDRGGESDGSELAAGRDPLWERDDAIAPIEDAGVVEGVQHIGDGRPPESGTVQLRFPAKNGYRSMHVYRTDALDPTWADFTEVGTIDVHNANPRGLFNDVGLADHTKVHYSLRAEGLSSVFTAPSDIFSATPPPPELSTPGGSLRLNCGGPLVVDSAGRDWLPDAPYLFRAGTTTSTTAAAINDAPLSDPDVPQNALRASRTGDSRYDITVPNGDYLVTLYFSENCPACVSPGLGGSGCSTCIRRFGVDVEGQRLEVNPADAAIGAPADGNGAVLRATEVSFDIRVLDQRIDIDLEDLGNGSSFGDPVIQAIAIENLNPLTLSRGDCNGDGTMDLSDAFKLIGYLFFGDPAPPCLAACDSNGDGLVGGSVADIVYLLIHLFNAGPAAPASGRLRPRDTRRRPAGLRQPELSLSAGRMGAPPVPPKPFRCRTLRPGHGRRLVSPARSGPVVASVQAALQVSLPPPHAERARFLPLFPLVIIYLTFQEPAGRLPRPDSSMVPAFTKRRSTGSTVRIANMETHFPRAGNHPAARAGSTLIELTVMLAVSGVLLATLGSVVSSVQGAANENMTIASAHETANRTLSRLLEELDSAQLSSITLGMMQDSITYAEIVGWSGSAPVTTSPKTIALTSGNVTLNGQAIAGGVTSLSFDLTGALLTITVRVEKAASSSGRDVDFASEVVGSVKL